MLQDIETAYSIMQIKAESTDGNEPCHSVQS